ncbi:MAG: flagellar biosynthetic protein FliO [Phycisphaerae bacterium]|nr:flagellar biosynthetic protein FliO [Phycisphaerae bacterium]
MNPAVRMWDLTVRAGTTLCCALILCAATLAAGDAPSADQPAVATPSTGGAATPAVPSATSAAADAAQAQSSADTRPDIPARSDPADPTLDLEKNLIGGHAGDADQGDASSWLSFVGPLVAVLGVMALVLWAARKFVPGMRRMGGSGVVRVLARTHLSPRQSIVLVKVGARILVVGQTADQISRLDSITDGDEVSHLLGQCHGRGTDSPSDAFQGVLSDADRDFAVADDATQDAVDVTGDQDRSAAEPELGRVRSQLDELARKVREVAGLRR